MVIGAKLGHTLQALRLEDKVIVSSSAMYMQNTSHAVSPLGMPRRFGCALKTL